MKNNFDLVLHKISTLCTKLNSLTKFYLLGKDFEVHQNRFTAAVTAEIINLQYDIYFPDWSGFPTGLRLAWVGYVHIVLYTGVA